MSDPLPSRPELPIVPALVVSSLLGGLIVLGLTSVWRVAFSGPMNSSSATVPSIALPPTGAVKFVEFLPPLTPLEMRIEEALEKPAECDFADTPLTDVVAYFAEYASIKMVIDNEGLTEEGIASDTPVTFKSSGLRLRSILSLILEPLQLSVVPKDEVLLLTTPMKSMDYEFIRTYPVSDLCRSPTFEGLDFETLIWLIEEETSGPWMTRDGEGGVVTELPSTGSISVRQRYGIHREILDLLRNLRIAQRTNIFVADKEALKQWDEQRAADAASLLKRPTGPVEFVEVIGTTESDAERRIEKALDKNVTLNFQKTPLTDAVVFFSRELAINVLLDRESLDEAGIAVDTPLTLQLQSITTRSALELLLKPLGLDYVTDREVLTILSTDHESRRLTNRTYPVSDLVGQNANFVPLMQMLENSTSGQWLNRDGEGGTMSEFAPAGSLVVRQTPNVHRQVLHLLRQQREAQRHLVPTRSEKSLPSRR